MQNIGLIKNAPQKGQKVSEELQSYLDKFFNDYYSQGYFHDVDKLLMYIIGFPKKLAHKIHVATAPHHERNGRIKRPFHAIIDWECARFTKPDKPLTAREYYESYFVEKRKMRIPEIEDGFKKLGL